MSSSGEEVEMDNLDGNEIDPKETTHWNNDMVNRMVTAIVSQVPAAQKMAPFYEFEIDWAEVEEAVGFDENKCRHKWNLILDSVRLYRTMDDVAQDILQTVSRAEITKTNRRFKNINGLLPTGSGKKHANDVHLNLGQSPKANPVKKKKRKVNPDHPARPKVSGYSLFCAEKMKSLMTEQSLKGVPLMLKLASCWKELPDQEKTVYNAKSAKQKQEYLSKVRAYAEKHPDDEEIQSILAEEEAKPKPKHTKIKKRSDTETTQEEITDLTMDSLDDTRTSADSTVMSSPNKSGGKRHTDDSEFSQDSSPRKKKRKVKEATGEDIYFGKKYESYRDSHSDLDEDQIREKLGKKYRKMSDDKKAKYETMAKEKNG